MFHPKHCLAVIVLLQILSLVRSYGDPTDRCSQSCVHTSRISRVARDEPESLCGLGRSLNALRSAQWPKLESCSTNAMRMMNATLSKYCGPDADDSTGVDLWNSASEFYNSWRKHIEAASCGRICSDYRTTSLTICCVEFGDCYFGSVLDEMKPRYPRDTIEFVIAVEQFAQGSFHRYAYGVTLPDECNVFYRPCPIGTVQGITRDGCYLYSSAPLTWFKAEEECMSRNGHLASVSNGLINAFLQEPANLACSQEYWLGGSYNVVYQSMWTWTDRSRFSYTHWARGEPTNNGSLCLTMDVRKGVWYSRSCDNLNAYICKVPSIADSGEVTTHTPPTCPMVTCPACGIVPTLRPTLSPNERCPCGWVFLSVTGRCYKVLPDWVSWKRGREQCNQLGAELASIPSSDANTQITEFAHSQVFSSDWFLIGLRQTDGNWWWTDGSPASFLYWWPSFPRAGSGYCVFVCAATSCGSQRGMWTNNPCGDAQARPPICQMPAIH